MADETNQNDQVKDLLARLRSQMSQLDEAFGLVDGKEKPESTPVVAESLEESDEIEIKEAPALEAEAPEETVAEAVEQSEDEDVLPDELTAAEPSDGIAEPAPVTESLPEEEPSQLDFFDALDVAAPSPEDGMTPEEDVAPALDGREENIAPDFDEGEDEELVFAETDAPVYVRRESIVAEEPVAATEEISLAPVVVEIDRNEAQIREKTETHTSVFVPDAPHVEEPIVTDRSPFAPQQRFDPSKYDAVLAAYAQQAQGDGDKPQPPHEEKTEKPPVVLPESILFSLPAVEQTLPDALPPTEEEAVEAETEVEIEAEAEESAACEAPSEQEAVELEEETETATEAEIEAEAEAEAEAEPETEAEIEAEPEAEADMEAEKQEQPAPPSNPQAVQPSARVVLAADDLSDNDRGLRTGEFTGRVHLAPSAYRIKSENILARGETGERERDEEDYMQGLPQGLRRSLESFPLGRPNRAQSTKDEKEPLASRRREPKRRRRYLFPEECNDGSESLDVTGGYLRHQLKEDVHQTRGRLIIIAVLSFILLLLENITKLPDLVPHTFVDGKTAGMIDMLLLLGVTCAAWPRLRIGFLGIFRGRILTESVLALEVVIALLYAAVFGALEMPVLYFSFVPALGLALLYSFRVLDRERQLRELRVTKASGEKLVFSPTARKDMRAELRALGEEGERTPLVYRLCKTEFVGGFFQRNAAICEDERLNLGLLLAMLLVGVGCFFISFFLGNNAWHVALQSGVFGAFLTAPLLMCAAHIFPMHRTERVAGEDSAIVGEATVRECVSARAVTFEDTEGMSREGVSLSGIQVHCNDPAAVFKYLTALYGHIGGPLHGSFSGIYVGQSNDGAFVELIDATGDGVCAIIDGAEIVVGNGRHMVKNRILAKVEAREETMLPSGRSGVLYVAVNGMVCMKFYMEHHISHAFEKNVLRLHRLGLETVLRTYDPNFNEKTLARNTALGSCRVHVVSKRADQLGDICLDRADSGIVTHGDSHKLLRLLLLCFRTSRALRFGWIYKLAFGVLGGGAAVLSAFLGLYSFIPSVYLALYHLVTLFGFMVFTTFFIRLPDISEEK